MAADSAGFGGNPAEAILGGPRGELESAVPLEPSGVGSDPVVTDAVKVIIPDTPADEAPRTVASTGFDTAGAAAPSARLDGGGEEDILVSVAAVIR